MAFENLGDKLQEVFRNLKSKGVLTEADIKVAMREVKLALLEADVNFKVVKDFVATVSEKAVGEDILNSLTPGQNVIRIVRDEMTALMGSENERLNFANNPPTVIMLCGLQGAGKTTACGKLSLHLRKQFGKRPLMVACDVYRPAAIKQLEVLGAQINIPVFAQGTDKNPVDIAKEAIDYAKVHGNDPVIIDTAGRLQIDEALMQELKNIKSVCKPNEILLVVDAMTGQDAVNVSQAFDNDLDISGVILSKLDGDTRGGAALSVKAITGKPIKFSSTGEKLSDLEPFHPERMASRILGMGDVLTLIDRAQDMVSEEEARELEKKMRQQTFDLEDFLAQLQQIKKLGSMSQLIGMIPGIDRKTMEKINTEESEKKLVRTEAIIKSMTPNERHKPQIIAASRKVRIAKGSGTRVQDVNELLRDFEQMRKAMKELSGPKQAKLLKRMKKMKFN